MSTHVTLDDTRARSSVPGDVWDGELQRSREALATLAARTGAGNDFLGWIDLPEQGESAVGRIEECAARLREKADVLVVVGIGGSYLGARAVIDACTPEPRSGAPEIRYAGHHLSGAALSALLRSLDEKHVAVNVISKSGTTTEPALAFRVLKDWMEKRYGKAGAAGRIVATTDASHGALRALAEGEGYETFTIPDDVGGRFSVLTPVGLLPIAARGIDPRALLAGAAAMKHEAFLPSPEDNPALRYAALRRSLAARGKSVEVLASFEPALHMACEWWKQLFGESEGKNGMGIFPASVVNTTDLHSMGQYIQDGARLLFETFLLAGHDTDSMIVPSCDGDPDGLEYLAGRSFDWINEKAWEGTALAHESGGTPNLAIRLHALDAASIGALLYFFEVAVSISGYAMGINPFDQPGVEQYKCNMFALLGKSGFEESRAALLERLKG